MKRLARSGGETPVATPPLPTIATGSRARSLGLAANDNRLSLARRLLPPGLFLASLLLFLAVL
jgi:hypothetical protein